MNSPKSIVEKISMKRVVPYVMIGALVVSSLILISVSTLFAITFFGKGDYALGVLCMMVAVAVGVVALDAMDIARRVVWGELD